MTDILKSLMEYYQLFFDLFNENSGVITAVAGIELAIVTTCYVFYTKGLVRETRRQADQLLNERRIALRREIVERIYLQLKPQIILLTDYDYHNEGIPTLERWENITRDIPHLAYQIDQKLFAEITKLGAIRVNLGSTGQNVRRILKDVVTEVFGEPTLTTVGFLDITGRVDLTPLELLLAKGDLKDTIQQSFGGASPKDQIDVSKIQCIYFRDREGARLIRIEDSQYGKHKFAEFNERWNTVDIRVKENPEFSTWIKTGKELVSKAKAIVNELDDAMKMPML